ncbi:MAG: hypothetical protein E7576_07685 [Ruminococcaceae bacterium]|nr:hypothetical protein [Oscillospiraceae bacterium]
MIGWFLLFLASGAASSVMAAGLINYRDARTVVSWTAKKGKRKAREVRALVERYSDDEELMTKGVQRYIVITALIVSFVALTVVLLTTALITFILYICGGAT